MGEEEYLLMFGKSRAEMVAEAQEELRQEIRSGKRDKAKIKVLMEKLKRVFIGDDVFWANEVASNMFIASMMIVLIVLLEITLGLAKAGVFDYETGPMLKLMSFSTVQLLIGAVVTLVLKGEKKWLKHFEMVIICSTTATLSVFFGCTVDLLMALPVVLSIRYLSEKFTRNVAIFTGLLMLTSEFGRAYFAIGYDLNSLALVPGTVVTVGDSLSAAVEEVSSAVDMKQYVQNLLNWNFLPNLLEFVLISFVSETIAKWCHRTVLEQASVAKEFSRVDTELNMARDIQANMLPRIFPAFPDRKEFDIYATMDPAKEVGGDFYDFFLVDPDHLAVVIADVSGKGVPAALFMMIGKAFLKNQAMTGAKPSEVFDYVNKELCENNHQDLFITAWMGILEISTGHMICCNAGHEFPMVRHSARDYQILKDKHGFVLAGMEFSRYKDYEIQLNPGDGLFLYTDGATEATNKDQELFGMDRLLDVLKRHEKDTPEDSIKKVRKDIDAFVGDADQFDDITMVELLYKGPEKEEKKENE